MAGKSYLGVNIDAWSVATKKLAYEALPSAVAEVVNTAAFRARDEMSSVLNKLDRPNSFTFKPWIVVKAKAPSRDDFSTAVATLKPRYAQEKYLAYVLYGGERTGGSPGAWPDDVPVSPEDHQDQYGNRVRSLLGRIKKARKEEKEFRKAGFVRLLKVKTFEGYFFGTVGGVKGYYRRPARKVLEGPRKKGVRRWENLSPPDLMIAVYPKTKHKEKLREAYDNLMVRSMMRARADFGRILAEKMDRLAYKKLKSTETPTMRIPDFLREK